MAEPISTIITLGTAVVSLIKRQRAKQATAQRAKVLEVAKKILDQAHEQGRYDDIQTALNKGQVPTELIEYAKAIVASKPMIEIQQGVLKSGYLGARSTYTLPASVSAGVGYPSVSSGELKETITKNVVQEEAFQLATLQKYWYVIPIILIPLLFLILKKKR